jgi:superfamily II DNA or RNA helicase
MRFPTFDKPRIVHCCEDFPKHIGLPRGCLEDTTALLHSLGIQTKIVDERFEGERIKAKFNGTLRSEQQKSADALLEYDTGVLAASTAFGKTVIAAYLIGKRSVNTLILVHLKELLHQWIARLNSFLDVTVNNIGQIGGGKRKPTGIIDVATIQSLGRKGVVDDIVAKYGYLIVDECHHISARSFEIVARQCKAKYVTGLSATVTRKDGHHPIIFMNCGPVRYKVDDKKQASERPFAHKVIVRETDFKMPASFEAMLSMKFIKPYYKAMSATKSLSLM